MRRRRRRDVALRFASREMTKWLTENGWHKKIHLADSYVETSLARTLGGLETKWGREIVHGALEAWENERWGGRRRARALSSFLTPVGRVDVRGFENLLKIPERAKHMWRDIPAASYEETTGFGPDFIYTPQGRALSTVITGTLGDVADAIEALGRVPGDKPESQ
jgi:hypothetical protein